MTGNSGGADGGTDFITRGVSFEGVFGGAGSVFLPPLCDSFRGLDFACVCLAFFVGCSSPLIAFEVGTFGSDLSSGCGVPGLLVKGVTASDADCASEDVSVSTDTPGIAWALALELMAVFTCPSFPLPCCFSGGAFFATLRDAEVLCWINEAVEVDDDGPSFEL